MICSTKKMKDFARGVCYRECGDAQDVRTEEMKTHTVRYRKRRRKTARGAVQKCLLRYENTHGM